MTTGAKIQYLRKKQNITQEQLAEYLGVSRQSVSKWESDGAYPETDKLVRLSTLFQVSLDYLLRDDFETVEQLTQKNETIRFNNETYVFAFLSAFGYVGGVALTYITLSSLVGFLVLFGMISLSVILYLFRRVRFLSKTEFCDADRQTLMRNTRILYSAAWMAAFVFLPLMIPLETRLQLGGDGPYVIIHGILPFGIYVLCALMTGLLGLYTLTGINFLHREKSLNRSLGKLPLGILIRDLILSTFGGLAFLVLCFILKEGMDDYALLVASLLVVSRLIVDPIIAYAKKRIPIGLFLSCLLAAGLNVFAILWVLDVQVMTGLGWLVSGFGLIVWTILCGKDIKAAIKEKDFSKFLLLKGTFLTLLLTAGIIAYRWGFYMDISSGMYWKTFVPILFSLVLTFGSFEPDRIFMKSIPASVIPNGVPLPNQ